MATQTPSDQNATSHHAYPEERHNLDAVLRAVDGEIAEVRARPNSGGDGLVESILERFRGDRLAALESLKYEAYFGRIIVTEHDSPESFYISMHNANADGIRLIDWRAPMGSIYYQGKSREQRLRKPNGVWVDLELLLRRELVVRGDVINRIYDSVDYRMAEPEAEAPAEQISPILMDKLAERGERHLQDIVRTIQAEQDYLIRVPHQGVLVVNGVAGSGKTSIAFHRLAYLLYPDNNTGVTSDTSLVIGPSPLFLSYTQELLPDLGEAGVPQTTFADWALDIIYIEDGSVNLRAQRRREGRPPNRYRVYDPVVIALARRGVTRAQKQDEWRASRERGRLRMRSLMSQYAKVVGRRLMRIVETEAIESFSFESPRVPDLQITIDADRVRSALASGLRTRRPGGARDAAVARLLDDIESGFWGGTEDSGPGRSLVDELQSRRIEEKDRKTFRDQMRRALNAHLAEWTPALSVPTLYYELLDDKELLQRLSDDLPEPVSSTALRSRRRPGPDTIWLDDIPAMLALHVELFGAARGLRHVVVDEAQDLAPLCYALIADHCTDLSMTLLGDFSQGVFGYRGSGNWNEVHSAFVGLSEEHWRFETIDRSYRSTHEIVEFCNGILQTHIGADATLAVPIDRHGEVPAIHLCPSRAIAVATVAGRIEALAAEGYSNIAVLTKTPSARRNWSTRLAKATAEVELDELDAGARSFHAAAVSVMTGADAKGLEFEAVIVVDADDSTYDPATKYDVRSLYVACSRALHRLEVVATGKLGDLLRGVSHLGRVESVLKDPAGPEAGSEDAELDDGLEVEGEPMEDAQAYVQSIVRKGYTKAEEITSLEQLCREIPDMYEPAKGNTLLAWIAEVGPAFERPEALRRLHGHLSNTALRGLIVHIMEHSLSENLKAAAQEVIAHYEGTMEPYSGPGWWTGG